jgi:outer membrane protein OmpA-like peptidoglycan-associated protein
VPAAPVAATPAPPRPVAAATPAPAPVATPAPPPAPSRPVPATTPSGGALAASVAFSGQSAELSDEAKAALDRVAKNVNDRSLRQIELRAHTGTNDPESRKVSLARALIVRSYLIDKGVKSRIEIGAFAGDGGDRVDILVPGS